MQCADPVLMTLSQKKIKSVVCVQCAGDFIKKSQSLVFGLCTGDFVKKRGNHRCVSSVLGTLKKVLNPWCVGNSKAIFPKNRKIAA